ncbi:unnamed protein product [Thlaspi arvense]|uniref:DUF1985 domain-containing protein n=1 Tax=Thlaspi arvense TaxID=13288 RepID=A0AAU9SG30_THLAR|nr:unnamed protein product [Thlaspi arvense]
MIMDIILPKLVYEMGKEPVNRFKSIDKYSDYKYIEQVKEILGPMQFKRIQDSFGQFLKFSSRKLYMAGKMIHAILTKSLTTKKNNELWFHFGGHPMRFSIREFQMVMGLKYSEWFPKVEAEANNYDWGEWEDGHTPEDLIELMIQASPDTHDVKFCLEMFLLIETIFLYRYLKAKFTTSNLEKAQDMKKNVPTNLQKVKYTMNGFLVTLHIWILESVPKLQSVFSAIDKTVPPTDFLCVKYIHTISPSIKVVLSIEDESDIPGGLEEFRDPDDEGKIDEVHTLHVAPMATSMEAATETEPPPMDKDEGTQRL